MEKTFIIRLEKQGLEPLTSAEIEEMRKNGNQNGVDLTLVNDGEGGTIIITPEGAGQTIHVEDPLVVAEFVHYRSTARPAQVVRSDAKLWINPQHSMYERAIQLLRFTSEANVFSGTSGNLSVRATAEGDFLVSPTGVEKARLRYEDMVFVRGNDSALVYYGERKPSIDAPVQGAVYRRYPHIAAMVHLHADGCGVVDPIKTVFPYPCGTVEEVDEVIGALERSDFKEGHGGFCVELAHHGYLIGFTRSHLCRLSEKWGGRIGDIQPWRAGDTSTVRPLFQKGWIVGHIG